MLGYFLNFFIPKISPLNFSFGSVNEPLTQQDYATLQLSTKKPLNNLSLLDTFVDFHPKT